MRRVWTPSRPRTRPTNSSSQTASDAPPGATAFRTGCTAVVDAKLQGPALTGDGVLCDILAAQKALKNVLDVLDHADLDTLPGLEGANTTVEVVAKFTGLHRLAKVAVAGGDDADVDVDLPVAAQSPDAPVLDRLEHLGLQAKR